MREIRSRIADRHGVDLSNQQIQELAARRLEAILDPRAIKPSLLDEIRRASGLPADSPPKKPQIGSPFNEAALYESPSGFVRFMRRLLNPLLRLLINPAALTDAFQAQTEFLKAAAVREAELGRRQAEWNALHFEVLRRLVLDIARTEIDTQNLAQRAESLAAKVDFNERRVRGFEQSQLHSKPAPRVSDPQAPSPSTAPPRDDAAPAEHPSPDGSPEARRRRRRRRGRRAGGGPMREPGVGGAIAVANTPEADPGDDVDDAVEDASFEGSQESVSVAAEAPGPPGEPAPDPASGSPTSVAGDEPPAAGFTEEESGNRSDV
jgi:hypothetical protein